MTMTLIMTIVVMKEWQFLNDTWDELIHGHKELWKNELYKKTMMMLMVFLFLIISRCLP